MLISPVGGGIIPSFTRNWLTKNRADVGPPHPESRLDRAVLGLTVLALFAVAPDAVVTARSTIIAGSAIGLRMSRWQGHRTTGRCASRSFSFSMLLVTGLVLLGPDECFDVLPTTAALHALTVGAIGTMTLAVMTRASFGQTGRPLVAGWGTQAIYVFVTLAALLRVLSPLKGAQMMLMLWAAGASWSAAFGLFAILYGRVLTQPRVTGHDARPI